MSEHVHDWQRPKGPQAVILTNPPLHTYACECGAFTHHPETGEPCWCHPRDVGTDRQPPQTEHEER